MTILQLCGQHEYLAINFVLTPLASPNHSYPVAMMIPLLFMTASRESKLKMFNTTNKEAYSCLVSKDMLIWVINLWRLSYSYL